MPPRATVENPLGLVTDDPAGADDWVSTELVLPCGRLIEISVASLDVIHALGELHEDLEVDGIPGIPNKAKFRSPDEPKAGRLRCVQLCGPGHKDHHAPYRFVTKEAFDAWCQRATENTAQKPKG
jgi:cytochrome c oxidase subunit 2